MVIGLMISEAIPHQPCQRLSPVILRCAAMPQRRQNGPLSFRNRITISMP